MCIIHPATIMLHSITYYQIINFQHHIIAGYLIEYRLCDFDVRSFVFYDHSCWKVSPVKHRITSFSCAVQLYHYFVGKECVRISFVCNKKVNKVLPYPFFRGKCDISFAITSKITFFPFRTFILVSNTGRFNDNIYYFCKLNNGFHYWNHKFNR